MKFRKAIRNYRIFRISVSSVIIPYIRNADSVDMLIRGVCKENYSYFTRDITILLLEKLRAYTFVSFFIYVHI